MSTDQEVIALDAKWGERSLLHDSYLLAHFKARPSDILITTAAKAGTTWMQQILHQLRTGGDDSFESIHDVVPWLELQNFNRDWRENLKLFESLKEPRIFKTHCTFEQTPGADTAKIILSSRDPRDCCVSFYHHFMNMSDAAINYFGFARPETFEDFFSGWIGHALWYRNVASWWPHRNKENVLWLKFEDMKESLPSSIDSILSFLNWEIDEEQREKILHYCSFEWMKENNHIFSELSDSPFQAFDSGNFIRKGKVGDYKNLLTPEHEAIILEKARDWLDDDCLKFLKI